MGAISEFVGKYKAFLYVLVKVSQGDYCFPLSTL